MKNIITILAIIVVSKLTIAQVTLPQNPFENYGTPILRKPVEIDRNGVHQELTDPNEGNYPNNPPIDPQTDDERYVFWLHGLNGNIGSWIRSADASQNNVATNFAARKLKSVTVIDYTQDANVFGASQQVGEQIEDKRADQLAIGENPNSNFIIAHSQGGVVGRGLMHRDLCLNNTTPENLGYGGIVTFGTPNQGARILNNQLLFNTMATDMCSSLSAGPAAEISNKTILNLYIFSIQLGDILPVKDIVEKVCQTFLSNFVDLVKSSQLPNITEGYKVGAPDITSINNCTDADLVPLPKVAFYGIEPPEGLLLRTAAYFLKSPNEFNYFQANDDNFFKDAFMENKLKYDAAVAKWMLEYQNRKFYREKICSPWQFPPQWVFCSKARANEKKALEILNAYKQGQDWFNRLDDQYKTIIGAIDYTKTTKWYCECENVKTGAFTSTLITNPNDCPSSSSNGIVCEAVEYTTYTQIKKDSDGVVLAESAMNIPFATAPPRKMINSSHMQMRNDENTRTGLNAIYNGDVGFFFKTGTK